MSVFPVVATAVLAASAVLLAAARSSRFVRALLANAYPTRVLDEARCAIVVLDPLETYRSTFSAASLRANEALLTEATRRGVPIVFTKWVRTRGFLRDTVDEIGSWTEFVPTRDEPFLAELRGFAHAGGERVLVLHTVYADAFAPVYEGEGRDVRSEGVLAAFLRARGVDTLVLSGTWAEACVERTAYTASTLGLTPVVFQPGIGGYAVRYALARMNALFAHVVRGVRWRAAA